MNSQGKNKVGFVAVSPKQSIRNATGQAGGLSTRKPRRVFVAMSGGVDSSVAAFLLKKQSYDVTGIYMNCFNVDGCSERDARDARLVAEKLGIPFYVWDFEEEYKKRVVEYMVEGYRQGTTPNPDVMCNREIKFGLFLDRAREMGADYVATGHHVRKQEFRINNLEFSEQKNKPLNPTSYILHSALDTQKDQSYFLWTLTQEKLRHCLFPIGDYLKSDVRDIAREAGLPTAEKKDSQGICFLGKVTFDEFLRDYVPEKEGVVLNEHGEEIGRHNGAQFYTIGQRHLGANLKFPKTGGQKERVPVYVAEKDVTTNTLVVAESSNNPALYKKTVELTGVSFTTSRHTNKLEFVGMSGVKVLARVRYRQPLAEATLQFISPRTYKLTFTSPQKFVALGQSAVFYERRPSTDSGLEMLGGGIIISSN